MKSMKWLMLALVFGLAVPAAMGAALVTKGSSELALAGQLDFATEQGADVDFRLKYAYFFWDRLSLGLRGAAGDNDAWSYYGIGVSAEYNFNLPQNWRPLFGTDLIPFLGVFSDYRYTELFDETDSAGIFGGEMGMKFFLTDSTAITLSLVGELATTEIYADDLEATDKDLSLMLGMRFYF